MICIPPCSTPVHVRRHFLSRQVPRGSSAGNSEARRVIGRRHFAANVTSVQQPISTWVCADSHSDTESLNKPMNTDILMQL